MLRAVEAATQVSRPFLSCLRDLSFTTDARGALYNLLPPPREFAVVLQLSTSSQQSWYERFLRSLLMLIPAGDPLNRLARHTLYDDVFLCQQHALTLARAPVPAVHLSKLQQEDEHPLAALAREAVFSAAPAGSCVPLTPHLELCHDTTDASSIVCTERACVANKRGLTCYCRLAVSVAV